MTWFYFALASSLFWALMALLQKDACHGEHAVQVSVASAIIGAGLAVFLLPFVKIPGNLLVWALLILSSGIYAAAFYLSSKGFKYLSVSEASPLYNIGTVIAVLMAVILLGEKLTNIQAIGITLVILGTYILELRKNDFLSPLVKIFKSEKIHFVLGATFLFSAQTILSKYILTFVQPLTFLFFQLVFSAIFMSLLVFVRHDGLRDIKKGFTVHRMAVFLIAVAVLAGSLFDFLALKSGEASLVLPISRTWTLLVVIFGGTFYKEGHIRNRLIATAIMLAGVFIIYL